MQVRTPKILRLSVWPPPRSLATTNGISVDVFSSPYLDVSVQAVPHICLFDSTYVTLRWVSPFGNLRIYAHLQLPEAYRSLSRPSSAPDAKAFPLRSFTLDLISNSCWLSPRFESDPDQTFQSWSNFLVLLKFELCRPSLDSFYRSNKIVIYPKISFYYSLNFLTVAFSYHTSRCVTIICFFLCSVFKIQCHSLSEMVGQNGLEPSTSRLSVVCSSQLSYWPIWWRLAGSNR